jgi:hypothetical protein
MSQKDEEAQKLADSNYQIEPAITEIYRLWGPAEIEARSDEPIKLLVINRDTIPTGIMPLGFPPRPGDVIHFRSIIVDITPEEYEQVRSGTLVLPHDWTVGDLMPSPCIGADR